MSNNTGSTRRHRGYVLVLALVFLGIFFTGSAAYLNSVTATSRSQRADITSAKALSLAEAGIEKAVYELNKSSSYSGETNTPVGDGVFTTTVTTIDSMTKKVVATGSVPDSVNPVSTKTIVANVGIDNSVVSFHYGIQAGQGGFTLENSSNVRGNVYSGGSVIGSGGNMIYGDVVSSGPSGLVYGIHATGTIFAHTIGNSGTPTRAGKDAYYVTKINTVVGGTSHPGSPDQPNVPLPISDEQITAWENMAEAGGTVTCSGGTYQISSGNVTLGPKKIPCNFVVSNSAVVTIAGHIWVTGNITIQNSAVVKMAPSLGATNVAIIADNPSNRITSSVISIRNSASFQNSGTPGSFVFLISQNNSAELGGSVTAIELSNSSSALVAYASHGLIPLQNSVSLKEVTAYKISMRNSASVTYDTGLPSAVFQSGPGGSWGYIPGSYAITQ